MPRACFPPGQEAQAERSSHIKQPTELCYASLETSATPQWTLGFSTALVPWIYQFEVLTLLLQSEITVSCWVSISMGLLSNTSSSVLAFASPIVLAETVICGGCPNFIFLANCCWKMRKIKQTNKTSIYITSKTSQAQCPLSAWELNINILSNFWLWTKKTQKTPKQSEDYIAATQWAPSLLSPHKVTEVRNLLHYFWFWMIEFLTMLPTFENLLWVLKRSITF